MPRAPRLPGDPPRRRRTQAQIQADFVAQGLNPDGTPLAQMTTRPMFTGIATTEPAQVTNSAPAAGSNTEHARFSPSAAHRWLICPGSIPLHEQIRAEPGYREPANGEASELGRLAHSVAEAFLNDQSMDFDRPAHCRADIRPLIEPYVRHVWGVQEMISDATGTLVMPIIEQRVMTGNPDCWGTIDAAFICHTLKEIWVIDLKTGHARVDPVENPQLLIYALGLMRSLELELNELDGWKVHLQIVQPRDEEHPIKSWTCGWQALVDMNQRIRTATIAADDTPPVYHPGDHCTYCPAASRCPALRARTMSVFEAQGDAGGQIPDPLEAARVLNDTQLSFFLANRVMIRTFLDAVEERARMNPPAGFKIVEGQSRRRWRDAELTLARCSEREELRALMRLQAPTITEVTRAGMMPVFEDLVERPPGSPQVVPESDPRPAIALGSQVFLVERSDPI